MDTVIRDARLRGTDGTRHIAIAGDRIAAVSREACWAAREIDAAGSLVLPGLFNLHFHADKSLLGEIMRPNVSGTLPEAIEQTVLEVGSIVIVTGKPELALAVGVSRVTSSLVK